MPSASQPGRPWLHPHMPVHTSPPAYACSHLSTRICLSTPLHLHMPVHTSPPAYACPHLSTCICLFTPLHPHLPVYTSPPAYACSHLSPCPDSRMDSRCRNCARCPYPCPCPCPYPCMVPVSLHTTTPMPETRQLILPIGHTSPPNAHPSPGSPLLLPQACLVALTRLRTHSAEASSCYEAQASTRGGRQAGIASNALLLCRRHLCGERPPGDGVSGAQDGGHGQVKGVQRRQRRQRLQQGGSGCQAACRKSRTYFSAGG